MSIPSALRDLALQATGLSFTIADARADDQPPVWVNAAFTTTTGWSYDEAVGRNCRFLQGHDTDAAAVDAIRVALDRGEAIETTLLNYTKDRRPFWNRLSVSPIHDDDGALTHFVGVQTDVTQGVTAQNRLRLISDSMNQLSGTLDFDEARDRLISLVVPALADWVLVVNVDDRGDVADVASAHRDPARAQLVAEFARDMPAALKAGGPVEALLLRGEPVRRMLDLQSDETRAGRLLMASEPTMLDRSAAIGAGSALLLHLPCRRSTNDLMIMIRDEDREQFDDEDVEIAADLTRRAGLILDNARLFRTTQRIAETLQRSLLSALPKIEGVEVAARYVAAGGAAEVGGDFYELMELPGGAIGLVVGDVLGHDVFAAAAMGHLKGIIRACAYDDTGSPATVLERVDALAVGLGIPTIATALYAHLAPAGDGWTMTVSSAGHPPLVVRRPDGSCATVGGDHAPELLLGVAPGPRTEWRMSLPAGATVVGYTDGLVERRTEAIDVGLARLVATVGAGPADVEELCNHLVGELGTDNEDDVAVIAVRLR